MSTAMQLRHQSRMCTATLVDVAISPTQAPEDNLSTNSDIEIDTTAPTATISKVNYDVSGVFTIEGDNFNTIDR